MRIPSQIVAVGVAFGLAFTGPVASASANPFTPDTLLFSANLGNSGDAAELGALATFLGLGTGSLVQDYKSPSNPTPAADGTNWYFDVAPDTPGYFMIKVGAPGGGPSAGLDSHYFFQNIAELSKLVFNGTQIPNIGTCQGCNIGKLSHYAFYDSVASVPVPAALPLAVGGLAFLGLVGLRRRHLGSASA